MYVLDIKIYKMKINFNIFEWTIGFDKYTLNFKP